MSQIHIKVFYGPSPDPLILVPRDVVRGTAIWDDLHSYNPPWFKVNPEETLILSGLPQTGKKVKSWKIRKDSIYGLLWEVIP